MTLFTAQVGWSGKRLENLTIENVPVKVSVFAWRDFMPSVNRDGSGLMVSFKIRPLDENDKLPSNINVISAEAIIDKSSEIWDMTTTKNKSAHVYPNLNGYSIVFREGPRWSINSYLDISLTIEINQQQYQIDAEYVVLEETM